MVSELVERLSEGMHEVVIGYRGETLEEIKARVEDGYLHIKFTQTKGGTELGIDLDLKKMTGIEDLVNNLNSGTIHIEGITNLNYSDVRCICDIDISTRKGTGYLQVL